MAGGAWHLKKTDNGGSLSPRERVRVRGNVSDEQHHAPNS